MKYVIALLVGVICGAVLCAAAIVYNPLQKSGELSPLTVTDARTISLSYTGNASAVSLITNNGESRIEPRPDGVNELWEKPVRNTEAIATVLDNARGQPAGIGIKFSSLSEQTRPLQGEVLVDSVWYVYLPGRGSLFMQQQENYWDYLREIVLPAYRNGANHWKGSWRGNVTSGPGALRTGYVAGGSGEFESLDTIGIEALSVNAWSVEDGPVSFDGRLVIELPSAAEEILQDEE